MSEHTPLTKAEFITEARRILTERGVLTRRSDMGRVWDWLAARTSTATADTGLRERLDDERAARKIAGEAADRFRDVLSECLGHEDENPGDDVLVAELREHFGRTGPEPTRWRDFCSGALATIDQINAERADVTAAPTTDTGARDEDADA